MWIIRIVLLFFVGRGSGKDFCDQHVRWQKNPDVDRIEGLWFAVGYAQHSPDFTSEVSKIGCVVLHLTDTTTEMPNESTDLSEGEGLSWHQRQTGAPAAQPAVRQLQLLWDEDGRVFEHVYRYSNATRGLWLPVETQPESAWPYIDNPQRHEVIKVLLTSPDLLVLNFCHDKTTPRLFSLALKRYPSRITVSDWLKLRSLLQRHDLSLVVREAAVCEGCRGQSAMVNIILIVLGLIYVQVK